jgi:hypothetical protein
MSQLLLLVGEMVLVTGRVNAAWHTSLEAGVVVQAEDLLTGTKRAICRAYFTFVALGPDAKKVRIPPLFTEGHEVDERRVMAANERRKLRFRRQKIVDESIKGPSQHHDGDITGDTTITTLHQHYNNTETGLQHHCNNTVITVSHCYNTIVTPL